MKKQREDAQRFFGISNENWDKMSEQEKKTYREEMKTDWDGKYYVGGK